MKQKKIKYLLNSYIPQKEIEDMIKKISLFSKKVALPLNKKYPFKFYTFTPFNSIFPCSDKGIERYVYVDQLQDLVNIKDLQIINFSLN